MLKTLSRFCGNFTDDFVGVYNGGEKYFNGTLILSFYMSFDKAVLRSLVFRDHLP